MTRIPNAHRLGWHVATVTHSTESALYYRLPDKPSRLKRILWLICVPLFLSLAWIAVANWWAT